MGRRHLVRRGNGRFTRPTVEGMFGLMVPACPHCGILNPHRLTEPAPERCHDCGASMAAVEAPKVMRAQRNPRRDECPGCLGMGQEWDGAEYRPCPLCVEQGICPRCGGELDGNCQCPAAACGWPD